MNLNVALFALLLRLTLFKSRTATQNVARLSTLSESEAKDLGSGICTVSSNPPAVLIRDKLLLFFSCIARESLRDGRAPTTVSFKLCIDLAQIVFFLLVLKMKPYKTYGLLERDSGEKGPFDSASGATIQVGSMHFNLVATAAGALYAIQAFTVRGTEYWRKWVF